MNEGMFNEYQLDYMRQLAEIPPEQRCYCGWYRLGSCPHCPTGKTCADKLFGSGLVSNKTLYLHGHDGTRYAGVAPSKPKLWRREPMTLIAAFWCAGDQAVLCADSQETSGPYKVSVTKLRPQTIGSYQIAYAGSGLSDLVDGLGYLIESTFRDSQASDWQSLKELIEGALTDFYESPPVEAYPLDEGETKAVSGIVCVRVPEMEKVFLFKFSKTLALPVTDFVLRGIEEPIYQHIAQRLYRPHILPIQAQLLGIHLLAQASKTSNLIDEPFSIVYAMTHGMFADNRAADVRLLSESLETLQKAMDDLLLECADTNAVTDVEAKAKLRTFDRQIMKLRKEQAKRQRELFKKYLHSD